MNFYQQFVNWMQSDERQSKRILFRCKSCKHSFAYDYLVHEQGMYRLADTFLATLRSDSVCPSCHSKAVTSGEVVGNVTHKHCNELCEFATGLTCNCSCGGKNHGKAYLQ
jgi:hypothetical protein